MIDCTPSALTAPYGPGRRLTNWSLPCAAPGGPSRSSPPLQAGVGQELHYFAVTLHSIGQQYNLGSFTPSQGLRAILLSSNAEPHLAQHAECVLNRWYTYIIGNHCGYP